MRIDDPIFSGSVVGSDAVVSLSGSFTGSGTIENANTASKLQFSASFGLGMEAFDFDGSSNQVISIDTASAHFISGARDAFAGETGSFVTTASISGLTQSFTKGDGSTFEINLPDTGSVDLVFSMSNGLGIETFTFDNTANASVQVDTSSAHIAGLTGSLLITSSLTSTTMSFTKGDGTTYNLNLPTGDTSSLVTTSSISGLTQSFTLGDGSTYTNFLPDTGSFITTASYSTGSIGGTVNTMSFTKGDGTTFGVHISNSVVSVTPSTANNLLAVQYEDGTTISSPVNTSSYADSSSFTRTAISASIADRANRVTASLSQALGIETFTYNGGTAATVQVDTSSFHVANLTASLVTTASISGLTQSFTKGDGTTFEINLPDTGSPTLSNQITGGLGIEAFTFNGTADAEVTLDTSSAYFTTGVSASQATTLTTLSASLTTTDQNISSSVATLSGSASTSRDSLSGSLTTTDQTISSSVASLSASAAAALTAQSASNAVDFVSQSIYNIQTGSFITTASISGLTQSFTKGDGTTFINLLPDTGSVDLTFSASNGLGIEAFSYDNTANAAVQLDTSSAHFTTGVSASQASTLTTLSASLTTTDQTISSSVAALSASTSTARDAISSSISNFVATEFVSESIYATQTGSFVTSATTQSGREEDTLEFTKGDGTTFDVTLTTSSFVKSVNGVNPTANGNVSTALTAVSTGTSASMLARSSSGNFDNGEVWIISGESGSSPISGSGSNGEAYIFDSGSGTLFKLANTDQAENDVRYVQVAGDTMTGQLVLPAANPTLANEATRKGYVDLFYDSSSIADASSQLSLHKGDGTIDIVSLAGISVSSSVSASNVGVADGRRITATTNPTQNFITLNDGASNAEIGAANNLELNMNTDGGAIGQVDFQNNGTSVANIDQDGTGSFNWVDSTASYANRTRHSLTTASANAGIIGFEFDGNTAQTIAIDTASAIFQAGVRSAVSGSPTDYTGSFTGSLVGTSSLALRVNNQLTGGLGIVSFTYDGSSDQQVIIDTSSAHFQSAVASAISSSLTGSTVLDSAEVSGSFTGSMTGDLTGTASFATKVGFALTGGLGVETFTYDGSARAHVQVNTSSAHFISGVSESFGSTFPYISGSFTGSLMGTASAVEFPLTSGSGIVAFSYVGAASQSVSIDTSSAHFVDGVAKGLSSASFAGLTLNFSGSNFDLSGANLSGSRISFSGSTLDLSGAVIYANTASYSGSFNYSGSSITSASIEAATFTGSSAFTGAFDFSNATITGLSIAPNYAPTTQSANFTAVAGRAYIVTQSSAAITMSLPATPTNGDSIKIANMDDRANLIARNGERIMGVAEDMTLNVEQVSFELIYESSPNMGWVIYGARAIT